MKCPLHVDVMPLCGGDTEVDQRTVLKSWVLESSGLGFEFPSPCSMPAAWFRSQLLRPAIAGQKPGASGPPGSCLSSGKPINIQVYTSNFWELDYCESSFLSTSSSEVDGGR